MYPRLNAGICAVLCLCAAEARGGIIFYSDLPEGNNATTIVSNGVTVNVTAFGGNFKYQIGSETAAAGVSGGVVDGEIDNTEYILFTFSQPVFINLLSVAYLYTAGNFSDLVDEHARFTTSIGNFDLVADTATTATWNGSGTVTNNSPAVEGGGATWTIAGADIFGGPITSLILESGNPGPNLGNADYGFRRLNFEIPGPGTLAGLGVLLFMPRRRRS